MNNNILKNNEYAKFGYGIVLDGLPDIPEFHFLRPQTRFSSNVIVIFLKSLNVWKDIAYRDSLHESFKKMCHFLSQILFHCFVCLCTVYVFSFYSVTQLCPYYVCSNPLMIIFSVEGHHFAILYDRA